MDEAQIAALPKKDLVSINIWSKLFEHEAIDFLARLFR